MSVLIVGAGPAGLAVSAVLAKAGVPSRILEKSDRIGGAYGEVDPSLLLLTPRELTGLPFAEVDGRDTTRISAAEYLAYLKRYQEHQRIEVEHGVSIVRVEKHDREFVLTDARGAEHRARQVVIATGSFGFPKAWPIEPAQHPGVRFLQAGDWRGIRSLSGQSVLVVGSGVYAAELATSLSERCKVYLSARGRLRFLPTRLLGIPIHKWLMPFERLPKILFPLICGNRWREPLIDVGLGAAIRSGKVALCGPDFRIEGEHSVQAVINATGFHFDTSILPADVARCDKGGLRTHQNESLSHKGLYVMGAHCAGGIDSKYLRGIRRDAFRIGRSIQRDLIS